MLAYSPGHPHAYKNFVLEHRLIMEQALGRYLLPTELVHHINENRADNRLENLKLTNHTDHARHHATGKRYPNRFRPRATKEAIVELYLTRKQTLRECAQQLNVSYGSLRVHCMFYGIPIRGKDPWLKRRK